MHMPSRKPDVPDSHAPVESAESGAYNPGPVVTEDAPNPEISYVQSMRNDVLPEEFPEGPYGSAALAEGIGKSEPWRPGQRAVSPFRDQNPVGSDRTTPLEEPDAGAPRGSIEGQN
jgi:hypothetical protein